MIIKKKKEKAVLIGDSEPIVPAIIYYMLKPFFLFLKDILAPIFFNNIKTMHFKQHKCIYQQNILSENSAVSVHFVSSIIIFINFSG